MLDYLLEEVLQRQSESVQTFLLRTSILDQLCGLLCDAVLRGPAGPGQATLEYLERANLFLLPLDNDRHWYRYHHLFADSVEVGDGVRLLVCQARMQHVGKQMMVAIPPTALTLRRYWLRTPSLYPSEQAIRGRRDQLADAMDVPGREVRREVPPRLH